MAVELHDYRSLSLADRWKYSGDLMRAAHRTPWLREELPGVRSIYGERVQGFRHMSFVRRHVAPNEFWAAVISGGRFGMGAATVQHTDIPVAVPGERRAPAQLAYWHELPWPERARGMTRVDIGKEVVGHLVEVAQHDPMSADVLWAMTLADDAEKAETLSHFGFEPVAKKHIIGDDGLARQIWLRSLESPPAE